MKQILSFFFLFLVISPHLAHAKSYADVFAKVDPSVVVIRTAEPGISTEHPGQVVTNSGLGSGVVISEEGLILTAHHVVNIADIVMVEFSNGQLISAKVVAVDETSDLALIRMDALPEKMAVAELGNSDEVRVGDDIFVIGAPYGIDHTLSVGHISGRHIPKNLKGQLTPVEFLQTDAVVNQGNSGGPLFNNEGQVIGIVSHIRSQSGGYEGLAFATTINVAKAVVMAPNSFWAGVDAQIIYGDIGKVFNIPQNAGLLVQRVADQSPGYYLGLQGGSIPAEIAGKPLILGGDIILSILGKEIIYEPESQQENLFEITENVKALPSGSRLEIMVWRGGSRIPLVTTRP